MIVMNNYVYRPYSIPTSAAMFFASIRNTSSKSFVNAFYVTSDNGQRWKAGDEDALNQDVITAGYKISVYY